MHDRKFFFVINELLSDQIYQLILSRRNIALSYRVDRVLIGDHAEVDIPLRQVGSRNPVSTVAIEIKLIAAPFWSVGTREHSATHIQPVMQHSHSCK